jgi:hypothetical protein
VRRVRALVHARATATDQAGHAVTTVRRKIRIECSCRAPELEPWRVGSISEAGSLRNPNGPGCSMMRDQDGMGTGFRLRCGRCPRNKEVTFAHWLVLVAELDTADADTLDIATLRF